MLNRFETYILYTYNKQTQDGIIFIVGGFFQRPWGELRHLETLMRADSTFKAITAKGWMI